jgi:radical SAM-linked protein
MMQGVSQEDSQTGMLTDLLANPGPSGRGHEDHVTAVVELRISGLAGFLSHSDLMRVAQRVCVRSGVELAYSQGFNPHPRMSMPLPKSVGLVSEGDILVMRVMKTGNPDHAQVIGDALGSQWPEGIEVLRVILMDSGYTLYPCQADFDIAIPDQEVLDTVYAAAQQFMDQTHLFIERKNWKKKHKTRQLDIRSYIKAIIKTSGGIVVTCQIRDDGAIRVDEMLGVLGVTPESLGGPIQRKRLHWRLN